MRSSSATGTSRKLANALRPSTAVAHGWMGKTSQPRRAKARTARLPYFARLVLAPRIATVGRDMAEWSRRTGGYVGTKKQNPPSPPPTAAGDGEEGPERTTTRN